MVNFEAKKEGQSATVMLYLSEWPMQASNKSIADLEERIEIWTTLARNLQYYVSMTQKEMMLC
jgi:hypothetical protein